MKKLLFVLGSLVLLASCAKEIIDLTGSVKGVVKDELGNLIEDCLISITPTGTAKITGADGCFEFTKLDPGDYTITAKKEGYTNTTLKVTVLSGKEVNADVVLKHSYGGIKGTVKSEEGFVDGCLVSLSPGGQTMITGTNGTFEFTELSPDEYTISFKKEGYVDNTQSVEIVAGKTVNVDVTLGHSYGGIKGTVKSEEGFVDGCLVSLSPGGQTMITGTNGTFEFTKLSPGEYTINFKKEDYVDNTQNVEIVAGKIVNVDVTLGHSYGGIKGVVRDEDDNRFIENCLVSLSPGGAYITTGTDGVFEFKGLAAGDYTLNLKKTGYPDKSVTTNVVKGKVTNVDVRLKLEDPISFSESELNFGDFETTKTFTLFNNSDGDCTFAISNIPSWLSLSQTNGSVSKQSRTTIVATANRDKIGYGTFVQNLIIAYSGRVSGEAMIKASIEKVLLTIPEVTIYSSAENVTENSFDIKGNIVATGGSQILDYGHCWSTKANPTTDENCTRLGQRNELGVYSSAITGLMTSTTYYVRAYARNAQGIAYSEQITVTTQDPYNDKWDGKIASGYAGGRGTKVEPYIIKTGGQLLYALKQGSGYLKLANNIDLNNHNWKPYEFSGTLDGNGCMISNLYIDRADEDGCGLIGALSGTVMNLTLRGVNVQGGDNVGAIAGNCGNGEISNCHVFLTSGSKIKGSSNVGGIVGKCSSSSTTISSCIIESTAEDSFIYGNENVGGITGWGGKAASCKVSCDIYGEVSVGGIMGQSYNSWKNIIIENSEYRGYVWGTNYVGGILGSSNQDAYAAIISCKAIADIEGSTYVGGICGLGYYSTIIACYSDGSISCNSASHQYIAGITGKGTGATMVFSYTTMQSSHNNFRPIVGEDRGYTNSDVIDCYSIYNCDNIAQKMEEAYSDYADYWNFDNTWTWTGTVDGKQKSVKCPRLAWE